MNQGLHKHSKVLANLFTDLYKHQPDNVTALPSSGSNRHYYRITCNNKSLIGAYNADVQENKAFFSITKHFLSKDLNVPILLAVSENQQYYLVEDLGDLTLFSLLTCHLNKSEYNEKMMCNFKNCLAQLVDFQIKGADGFDFNSCYPKSVFDRRSVMWDLNYFKYSFLKPSGVIFDEEKLEDDFESFANYLLDDDMIYFHYRDFQSRNIMVRDDKFYFIDYQGGRRGPCLYDVASFLYQAKAGIPESQRNNLFDFYLESLKSRKDVDINTLQERFPAFVLFRMIQTLGAYGYRGYFEGKAHFLQSIPPAIENLSHVLSFGLPKIKLHYLSEVLENVITVFRTKIEQTEPIEGLHIDIKSFSLKNGYPELDGTHGGGFIFDCRALQNPGRLAKYKELTGLDAPVADYLNSKPEVDDFMNCSYQMIHGVTMNYLQRGFKYLSVGFGCTGGQHRSVYCAERLAKMLADLSGAKITITHIELNKR
jgi:aminoglycoside/choline kinase family phosphotransferase